MMPDPNDPNYERRGSEVTELPKLVRPHEDTVRAIGRALEQEPPSLWTFNEMFKAIMQEGRGHLNPEIVKEHVTKIMKERYK